MISGLPADYEYNGCILSVRHLKKWRTINWLKMNIIEWVAGNNALCSGSQEVQWVEQGWSHLRQGLTYIYHLLEEVLRDMVTDAYGGCWLLIGVKTPYYYGVNICLLPGTLSQEFTTILPHQHDLTLDISSLLWLQEAAINDGGKEQHQMAGLKNITAQLPIQAKNASNWLAYDDFIKHRHLLYLWCCQQEHWEDDYLQMSDYNQNKFIIKTWNQMTLWRPMTDDYDYSYFYMANKQKLCNATALEKCLCPCSFTLEYSWLYFNYYLTMLYARRREKRTDSVTSIIRSEEKLAMTYCSIYLWQYYCLRWIWCLWLMDAKGLYGEIPDMHPTLPAIGCSVRMKKEQNRTQSEDATMTGGLRS